MSAKFSTTHGFPDGIRAVKVRPLSEQVMHIRDEKPIVEHIEKQAAVTPQIKDARVAALKLSVAGVYHATCLQITPLRHHPRNAATGPGVRKLGNTK